MLFNPKPLGKGTLSSEEVKSDLSKAVNFGQCAVSDKVIYIGNIVRANSRYIPVSDVERVFKRLAVTKGFFEQNKLFAAIPYLVVIYDGGLEKQVKFEKEDELDMFLNMVRNHTSIPVGKA